MEKLLDWLAFNRDLLVFRDPLKIAVINATREQAHASEGGLPKEPFATTFQQG